MHDLTGTWELVEWTFTVDETRGARPFGGDPVGLLTYTADGWMWAALMKRDRPPLPTTTISAAPPAARAEAAAGYLSYAGRYEVVGDEVHHHVVVSLMPNWVGETQVRHIEWVDNPDGGQDLVLSTPHTATDGGRKAVNRLRWRRAVPSSQS